jgi:hypothetical protein
VRRDLVPCCRDRTDGRRPSFRNPAEHEPRRPHAIFALEKFEHALDVALDAELPLVPGFLMIAGRRFSTWNQSSTSIERTAGGELAVGASIPFT